MYYTVYYIYIMITTKHIDKETRFLSKGDKLTSGAVVTCSPWSDSKTPSGKIHVGIQYPGEPEGGYKRTWGKYTKIGVITE